METKPVTAKDIRDYLDQNIDNLNTAYYGGTGITVSFRQFCANRAAAALGVKDAARVAKVYEIVDAYVWDLQP
ncbi:MAG: hypothetical protein WC683_19945 [bacterium]